MVASDVASLNSYAIGNPEENIANLNVLARTVAQWTVVSGESLAKICLCFSAGFILAALFYVDAPLSLQKQRGPYIALMVMIASILFLVAGEVHRTRATCKWALRVVLLAGGLGGVSFAEVHFSGLSTSELMDQYLLFAMCIVVVSCFRLLLWLCLCTRPRASARGRSWHGPLQGRACDAGDASLEAMEEVRERRYLNGDLHHRLDHMNHLNSKQNARIFMSEVHTRGTLFWDFTTRVRRSYSRNVALTSLWECLNDLLGHRQCLRLHCPRVLCADAWACWLLCLSFWLHLCQIFWEVLRSWPLGSRAFEVLVFSCFLLCILVINEAHRCQVLMSNDVEIIKDLQWEESTRGFPGYGSNVCVVSMSGRSKSFWFGLKGICKELGIGFACLWEVDWGDAWWPRWKANVREFGTRKGVELVVLIDAELSQSNDDRKRNTLLGSAQQLEVAYMLESGIEFDIMTNEEFVHYMKEKVLGSHLPLPRSACIESPPS